MNYQPEYFSGQGECFIAEYVNGKAQDFRFVGNAPSLSLSTSVDKKEHRESHSGMRTVDKVLYTGKNVAVSFTLEDVNIENLALAFQGEIITQAGTSVKDEVIENMVYGGNVVLANQKVSNLVISDNNDQPLVDGVDYVADLTFGRVTYISQSKTLQAPFKASYDAGERKKVVFLKKNSEYALRFEGLNTAENNAPVLVEVHKMAIEPAKTFELINEDLTQFEISGNALLANGELVTITKL